MRSAIFLIFVFESGLVLKGKLGTNGKIIFPGGLSNFKTHVIFLMKLIKVNSGKPGDTKL